MPAKKIYLKETLDIFEPIDGQYYSPAGIPPSSGTDLAAWITEAVAEGLITGVGGGGGGATNLTYTDATRTVNNDNGTGFILPLATTINPGLISGTEKSVLSNYSAVTGVANTATNLGTFAGTIIPDNASILSALQNLEAAIEANSFGQAQIQIKDHGIDLGTAGAATIFNIAGTGLTASLAGNTLTISSVFDTVPTNGSTNGITSDAVFDALAAKVDTSTYAAKGTIVSASAASTPVGLAVGANGTVLTADSSTASGLAWTVPAAGVTSVFTRTGAVVAANGDYTAAQITNAPSGNISAVTVQAALNELDSEKVNVNLYSQKGVILAGAGVSTIGSMVSTTNGQVLVVDTAQTTGLNFKALTGADIANTPAGNIVATTTQAAINEIDTEKHVNVQYQNQATNLGTTGTVNTINFSTGLLATRTGNSLTVVNNSDFLIRTTSATGTSPGYNALELITATATRTLPSATGANTIGKRITYKNTGTGTLTIAPFGGELLNGTATNITVPAGEAVTIMITGSGETHVIEDLSNAAFTDNFEVLTPTAQNTIPNLSNIPVSPAKVQISINGLIETTGISVNAAGVFTVVPATLGYNIEVTDRVQAQYLS